MVLIRNLSLHKTILVVSNNGPWDFFVTITGEFSLCPKKVPNSVKLCCTTGQLCVSNHTNHVVQCNSPEIIQWTQVYNEQKLKFEHYQIHIIQFPQKKQSNKITYP